MFGSLIWCAKLIMIPSYNYSHICQSSWVVVGGAACMEEVGGVVVGWDR